jgi:membrane protein implicated in regulation of membrane protease activity
MKGVGYLLLCAGFIIAAYATALDVENVSWPLFAAAAIAAVVGVVVIKRHARSISQSEEVLENNRAELRESIDNVVKDLREIVSSGSLRGAALRERIDEKLRPDLVRFADARESMVHLFGLQTYADIMSHFAAGERYVNRVWSSSADGYDVEAARYLGKAEVQFADAQRQLNEAPRK